MTVLSQRGLLGSSAVMAAGTIVSRIAGFAKAAVIAATLGLATVTADTFGVATVIPTMLYILVGGGALNSVLVPVLVKAIKKDADAGQAFGQRLFSVVAVVLGTVTMIAVLLAPLIVGLFVSAKYRTPELQPFFDDMVLLARFCLPQVLFYALYVLIGQMLNARGRFGPMMWAPIVNNLVVIAVFTGYLLAKGPKRPEPFSDGEVLLLGLGSTLGVCLQALVLLPVLARVGFRLRFRTDWRHAGLGQAARLGLWTIGFVLVNQLAYLFVVRAATGGSADAALGTGGANGAGYVVYANAMLIMMVPHSVITVSLATALLPRLADDATDGRLGLVRDRLVDGMRLCLAVIVPVAALLAGLSGPLAALLFGHGAATGETGELALTLMALLPGLVAFTVHYLVLRGFYAAQDTRTPFFVQLGIAATMVTVALLVAATEPDRVTVLLALGYSLAYLVGAVVSLGVLGRRLGGISRSSLLLHVLRLAIPAGLAALAGYGVTVVLDRVLRFAGQLVADLLTVTAAGIVGVSLFLVLAYAMRIQEVRDGVSVLRKRIRRTPPTMSNPGNAPDRRAAADSGAPPATPGEP
ncbi:MAG: murein biosynthesis integral membrane protein MurJ [Jiangellaceae bacterium]|nr:murein biosynthesis integral membrane protein MurJ [Jiangellaceae bacterium]